MKQLFYSPIADGKCNPVLPFNSIGQRYGTNRTPNTTPNRIKQLLMAVLCSALVYPAMAAHHNATPAAAYHLRAEVNIRYDSKSGKMSIKATDAPLSDLVSKLEAAYNIRLFVMEVSMDTKVTCDVQDKFIDDALREALPPSARFFYRFMNGSTEVEDRKPEARQARSRITSTTALKTRLQAQPVAMGIKPAEAVVTEKRTARTAIIASRAGNMPTRVATTSIRAQQLVALPQQTDDYYVKVTVKVTPNGYEPVSYTKVQGNLVNDSTASGDFVYQLKDNGRNVYTAAIDDPLELHSYSPDGSHKILQAKETYINITLPKQVLDKNAVAAPTLEFSRIRGEVVPENRNIKMLQATTLQRKGLISTEALQKVIQRK